MFCDVYDTDANVCVSQEASRPASVLSHRSATDMRANLLSMGVSRDREVIGGSAAKKAVVNRDDSDDDIVSTSLITDFGGMMLTGLV